MPIELSNAQVDVLVAALVWYLLWVGSGHIVGNWYYWHENRRRERETRRRERMTTIEVLPREKAGKS